MGIRKRLVWLIVGMILCQMCGGCGKEAYGEGMSEPTVGASDYMAVQEKTPAPVVTEPEQAATPVPAQEQAAVTEVPQEQIAVTEESGRKDITTQVPQAQVVVTAVPGEQVVGTELPQEPVVATEPPQEPVVATESPGEQAVVTEPPGEPVVATEAPREHVHSAQVALEEATCLEAGIRKEYCITCNEVLHTEKVNALGHDFTKSVWELPTCQKSGYYNNVCNRCGLVECVTQEPLPHEVEDIMLQEGNCMEDTVIQHVCKVCRVQVKEDTRYTRSDVHAWKRESIDGEEIVYCERCGVAQ